MVQLLLLFALCLPAVLAHISRLIPPPACRLVEVGYWLTLQFRCMAGSLARASRGFGDVCFALVCAALEPSHPHCLLGSPALFPGIGWAGCVDRLSCRACARARTLGSCLQLCLPACTA